MNIKTVETLSKFDKIQHGFFDRTDGYSTGSFKSLNVGLNRGDNNAIKNREKIAGYFGVHLSNLITLQQIHSTTIHLITRENITQYRECNIPGDGIVTNVPGVLIGVYTADCIPLLMYDHNTGYIAAIHCGWRGIFKGMLSTALQYMRNLGCRNLSVATGAFIHKLDLNPDLIPPEYRGFLNSDKNIYDLKALVQATMTEVEYEDLNIDTYLNQNYFSYRRFVRQQTSGQTTNRNGVQLSCIMIKGKII